jgi:hypothetical protein
MKAKLLYVVIVCGLLGWIVAENRNELRLQSLTRRWR